MHPINAIERSMESMKVGEKVDFLFGIIQAQMDAVRKSFDAETYSGFTKTEVEILSLLLAANGRYVSQSEIFSFLYSMRDPDKCPSGKIVPVHICHIRKKLRNHERFAIRGLYSMGWAIEVVE